MGGYDGSDMKMSGSMSDADKKKLKATRGAAFDRAFVEAMIEHRGGEIEMARDVGKDGRNATVKQQAAVTATMQEDEVRGLTRLLAKLWHQRGRRGRRPSAYRMGDGAPSSARSRKGAGLACGRSPRRRRRPHLGPGERHWSGPPYGSGRTVMSDRPAGSAAGPTAPRPRPVAG
ncbi:DUF305 domain-containing protein [Streptomyces sp. TRM68367]|uniref:DUF305 domain-containing protein n=1 Tax=Streptomyces sp. TRM68367 TaxID=2758415 RepID=UPI00165A660E|nr:DUF305 domain-containing protein [Streptomyces sp. TRM68367]MBC9723909.1 DUF305 domain-containing protein [Streptomyces sp. TRM68367]